MAIVDHSNALGNEVYPPQPPKDTLPKGEPIRPNQVDSQVRDSLKPHYSDWRILKKIDAKNLGESNRVSFFAKDGKHWIQVRDGQSASRFREWVAFVKPINTITTGGGGGSKNATQAYQPGPAPQTHVNLEPNVLIATPRSGSQLKLNDNKNFKNQLAEHTFSSGDTVSSVAKQYSGSDDPSAIFNFNYPSFTQTHPPQTNDTVRVLAGRELKVDGTVQNSGSVTLSWQGPTTGSKTIGNTQGSDNQVISWETAIPIQPGKYMLTATAGKAKSVSDVQVIDPNAHWLRLNLIDEDEKPFTEQLKYQVSFDDGTLIEGRFKNGTDYIGSVPFLPFTIEVLPGDEKQKELDEIIDQLEVVLKEEIVQVRANSEPLKKQWGEHPWYVKPFVADLYFKKGAAMWVWDTLKSVWSLIKGTVNVLGDVGEWMGTFMAHRDSALRHFINNNPDGVKRYTHEMKKMLVEVGEDMGDSVEMAQNLYYLAHNDRIPGVIKTFTEDYFDAISPQERSEFVSRYGIDIALIFVGGTGAALLGLKKADKIKALLDKALELIKVLRFKQKVKRPKVDETVPLGPTKKISKTSSGNKKKLKPNTPEHKADRWERYKKRGGQKDYDAWSKQYDTNMKNYKYGLKREADYRTALSAKEGTIKTPLTNRQIDILKADEMYAGQLKTGPVSLTKENVLAIQKDAELVKRGWDVEHILEKGASKPYLEALERAGIRYHIGSKIP